VLLTTQYLDEADALADRVAVIDHGRLISEGTTDELKDRLGGSVIQLSVAPELRAVATEALLRVNGSEPVYDEWEAKLTIPAPEGARTLMEVVRELDAAGIVPDDIGLHKPTLDDVFLSLTGRAAVREQVSEDVPSKRFRRGRRRRA
jgi:ABC-2 type transport system ATP-binding protein